MNLHKEKDSQPAIACSTSGNKPSGYRDEKSGFKDDKIADDLEKGQEQSVLVDRSGHHTGSEEEVVRCNEYDPSPIESDTASSDVLNGSNMPPPLGYIRRSESIPGAFRVASGLVPFDNPSFSVDGTETAPSHNDDGYSEDILVNAELVSRSSSETTRRSKEESVLVEASPLDMGIAAFLRMGRCFQFSIILGFLSLIACAAVLTLVLAKRGQEQGVAPTESPSMAPTTEEEMTLRELFLQVLPPTSLKSLEDSSSPQSQAFDWLLETGTADDHSVERILQRYALASLFFATSGPTTWVRNDGWLLDNDECNWFSKTTRRSPCHDGRYIHLDLRGNSLQGELPPEVGLLTSLTFVDMAMNLIMGEIPYEISSWTALESLDFSLNLFSGVIPTSVAALTQLEYLDLNSNRLTQSIPSEIGLLQNLVDLMVHQNNFQGGIPSELGQLQALQTLWLFDNSLTGGIPPELGGLYSLQYLSLEDNDLSGSIPIEVCSLSWLADLWLQRNFLVGEIPTEVGLLSSLVYFNVGNNTLEGTLPTEVGQLTDIEFLSVYDNDMDGTLPTELGQLTYLYELYVDSNKFSGAIPSELGLLDGLTFWAFDNNLTGPVPTELCELVHEDASGLAEVQVDCDELDCACLED